MPEYPRMRDRTPRRWRADVSGAADRSPFPAPSRAAARIPLADRPPSGRARRWRRAVARQRRLLAAGAVAAAVTVAVPAVTRPAPPTEQVVVAARDLPAGRVLTSDDLVRAGWSRGSRPQGSISEAAGRTLASPLRRGEPVTDARLVGRGLLTGQPAGIVAVSIRLADPATAGMLHPGDRVDVLAAASAAGLTGLDSSASGTNGTQASDGAERLAEGALLLAVGRGEAGSLDGSGESAGGDALGLAGLGSPSASVSGTQSGGLLVVAVDGETAGRLAALDGSRNVTVALTSGS